jgi:hypothetical protein
MFGVTMPRASYKEILNNKVTDLDLSLVRWDDEKVQDFFLRVLPANHSIVKLDLRHGSLNDDDFAVMLEGVTKRNIKLERLNLDHNPFSSKCYENFVKLIESGLVGAVYFYDYNNIFTDEQKSTLQKISFPLEVRLSFVNSLDRPASPSFFQDERIIALNQKLEERKDFSNHSENDPPKFT